MPKPDSEPDSSREALLSPLSDPFQTEDVRSRVSIAIAEFLELQRAPLVSISVELAELFNAGETFVSGGKRLRPVLAWWGWRGADGPNDPEALRACSSLEFIQACALVHDDVMDGSDTRRGQPSVHRKLSAWHAENDWQGDSQDFGHASAILLGDLFLSWADQMLFESGLPMESILNAKPIYDIMRSELMAGQFLDVVQQAKGTASSERSLLVARYKSAKYSVERPLQLGAALAGADAQLQESLSHFGLPVGEAFQLRDDVLGVFGDPDLTGKPAGDDVREGKQTFLIAETFAAATPVQQQTLASALGNPDLTADALNDIRQIIVDTGALDETEKRINFQLSAGLDALDATELANGAAAVLTGLAEAAVNRST